MNLSTYAMTQNKLSEEITAVDGITTQCLNRFAPVVAQDFFKVKRNNRLKFRKSIYSVHKRQINSWTCSHLSNYTSNHFKVYFWTHLLLIPGTYQIHEQQNSLSSTCIISMTSKDSSGCPDTFFTNAEQRFTNSPATQPCSNLGKKGPGRLLCWGWKMLQFRQYFVCTYLYTIYLNLSCLNLSILSSLTWSNLILTQKMPATQFILKSCMSELAKCVCGCILETNKNHEASSFCGILKQQTYLCYKRSGLTSLKRNQQSPYFDSQPFHVSNQIWRWLPSLKLT